MSRNEFELQVGIIFCFGFSWEVVGLVLGISLCCPLGIIFSQSYCRWASSSFRDVLSTPLSVLLSSLCT